jgi:hypothetical protein
MSCSLANPWIHSVAWGKNGYLANVTSLSMTGVTFGVGMSLPQINNHINLTMTMFHLAD